jgi:hypothetical protein
LQFKFKSRLAFLAYIPFLTKECSLIWDQQADMYPSFTRSNHLTNFHETWYEYYAIGAHLHTVLITYNQ